MPRNAQRRYVKVIILLCVLHEYFVKRGFELQRLRNKFTNAQLVSFEAHCHRSIEPILEHHTHTP